MSLFLYVDDHLNISSTVANAPHESNLFKPPNKKHKAKKIEPLVRITLTANNSNNDPRQTILLARI